MKAAYLTNRAGPEGLILGELTDPSLKKGEVVVEALRDSR
jgi:hypothetical protein